MRVSVIVPTFNEEPNVEALVRRVEDVVPVDDAEIVFVDDSTDGTPEEIERVAATSSIPVRMIHRDDPVGGLSGAVVAGFQSSTADWCLVMDGDLQHPPEMIPVLLETGAQTQADVVVASRYVGGGRADGLSGWVRHLVSRGSIALARSMFPVRLRDCTDPMTGFFAIRRSSIDMDALRPRGFKILLELLTRNRLKVVEEPFVFGERHAGDSKANVRQGMDYLHQLASLRFGRMSRFAVIGATGAVLNLAIMAGLMSLGVVYVWAAVVAALVTITGNFLLQERFVFRDLREGRSVWRRFAESFSFNATEAAVRLPFLVWIVEATTVPAVLAQAVTIAVAFLLRFVFHARVVYRQGRTSPTSPLLSSTESVHDDTVRGARRAE
ncbi:dolichol-phosphate mannosyltransferase [Paraoerskovia marina]|uniref:Dolichol-phosphate mannosyltransferase n=1 Tax=Paraoerskovia marina TaxID=545619 RepID=A0A1H1QHI3_9CELL|nr:glycosyltransferase family 2 protein [Paraoerskovia marina]SDS22777.1 dolichol-phosphate mannosyltransferase [Paraoerskovia marina]